MRTLIPGFTTPIEYPTSDGKPTAETELHQRVMFDLIQRLKAWAATQQDVYAAGNMPVYYQEGDAGVHLAPDAFVVFGVANHDRDTFRTWDGGAVPSVVFEIPSNTTRRDDTVTKRAVYQDVWEGNEYFLFDPLEDYLDPSLQGFRRVRGEFQPIPANADGSVPSRRLGLSLSRTGAQLTLRDTATGAMVLTEQEAEIARLKAELDSLKKRK